LSNEIQLGKDQYTQSTIQHDYINQDGSMLRLKNELPIVV